MGLIAKEPMGNGDGGSFEPVSAGLHYALCYAVLDLGTHPNTHPQAPQGATRHLVRIEWELPEELIEMEAENGLAVSMPKVIGKEYTLSLHKKAKLRQELESWRGQPFSKQELEGFDLKDIIGAPAMVQVVHVQSTKDPDRHFANVVTVTSTPKGTAIRELVHPELVF